MDTLADVPGGSLEARYRIEREIGRGGMARVFLGEDLRHGRRVAIKFLHPEVARAVGSQRFQREIETVSRLQHPHILPLYDSGELDGALYYVMPYVEEGSLRERLTGPGTLPAAEVSRLGREISRALDHAHRAGVVHRDLKPENVLLPGGVAVLADFGIAYVGGQSASALTETGLVLATPAYASPEQATGSAALDGRSDLYSLGCILYELWTGKPPFSADNAAELLARHLFESPPEAVPPDGAEAPVLAAVIRRSLEKRPGDRFATAAELAAALESDTISVGWAARSSLTRIAVMPFENIGQDPGEEWFSDGLTDEMILRLGRLAPERVQVIARSSAMRYKGTDKDASTIARELDARFLLEGSVRRAGSRIRVVARLVDGRARAELWSESYDRDMSDVFEVQSDVASRIADSLKIELAGSRPTRQLGSAAGVRAYEEYLRGRYHWAKRTPESFHRAIAHFERAIGEDPTLAQAHAGMADAWVALGAYGFEAPRTAYPKARAASNRALELDPRLAEAWPARGWVLAFFERQWGEAGESFRRATLLNPNYVLGHHWRAIYLRALGRTAEAAAAIDRALELDPMALMLQTVAGVMHASAGQMDRALAQHRRALDLEPDFLPALFNLGGALAIAGRFDEARETFDHWLRVSGDSPETRRIYLAETAYVHAASGRSEDARRALAELVAEQENQYHLAVPKAAVHVALSEFDQAFVWLERALQEGESALTWIRGEPVFAPLSSDPRYADLLRRIGVPTA